MKKIKKLFTGKDDKVKDKYKKDSKSSLEGASRRHSAMFDGPVSVVYGDKIDIKANGSQSTNNPFNSNPFNKKSINNTIGGQYIENKVSHSSSFLENSNSSDLFFDNQNKIDLTNLNANSINQNYLQVQVEEKTPSLPNIQQTISNSFTKIPKKITPKIDSSTDQSINNSEKVPQNASLTKSGITINWSNKKAPITDDKDAVYDKKRTEFFYSKKIDISVDNNLNSSISSILRLNIL